MADYRRYQPRRARASRSFPWKRIVFGALVLGLGYYVIQVFFGNPQTQISQTNQSTNSDGVRLITDNANGTTTNQAVPTNTNTPANDNTNLETNTNTAVAPPDGSLVSLENCDRAISAYGQAKDVALTFNLVAANDATEKVADALREHGLTASFFVTGEFAQTNAQLLKNLSLEGHGIYNRTQSNARLTELSADQVTSQLADADAAIQAATGVSSKPFVRPPFGDSNDRVVSTAKSAGYCTMLWTVDGFDWQSDATAQASFQRIAAQLRPGAIILLSAGYDVTPEVVTLLAAELEKQGYSAVSLVDLLTQ